MASERHSILQVMARALLVASIGAVGGYVYAQLVLPEKMLVGAMYPRLYAVVGAVVVLLVYRLGVILLMVLDSYRKKREDRAG